MYRRYLNKEAELGKTGGQQDKLLVHTAAYRHIQYMRLVVWAFLRIPIL